MLLLYTLLFFLVLPSLGHSTSQQILFLEKASDYEGTWYRNPQTRQNPNDVLNVGQFAMAQFSTLNSDFKPPTFGKTGEYKDSLTSENEWRLPDTWLRMPTAHVKLEDRLAQLTFEKPYGLWHGVLTHPVVSLPSGCSFSESLPAEVGKHPVTNPPTNLAGTWYRVLRGDKDGQDWNVIELGPNVRLGGLSYTGTINWKPNQVVTHNHLLGGWLLWPTPGRSHQDLLLFYVKDGRMEYILTSLQDYIRPDPVEQSTTLPEVPSHEPPREQKSPAPQRHPTPPPLKEPLFSRIKNFFKPKHRGSR